MWRLSADAKNQGGSRRLEKSAPNQHAGARERRAKIRKIPERIHPHRAKTDVAIRARSLTAVCSLC